MKSEGIKCNQLLCRFDFYNSFGGILNFNPSSIEFSFLLNIDFTLIDYFLKKYIGFLFYLAILLNELKRNEC